MERSNNGSLTMSFGGNPNLCASSSCQKKKKSFIIPIVAIIASVLVFSAATAAVIWIIKRRKQAKQQHIIRLGSLDLKKDSLSYSEIRHITNNFEKKIGEGGFAEVFLGNLYDTQVAVKVLKPSVQGYREFEAEVKLLLRIHHRNLTSLIGYCYENTNWVLIYEYIDNGNLKEHLSGRKVGILSWEERMQIAADAAQGLEYLHHGCRPPIVHRDVKSANILLTTKFQAKIADFGLSRSFPAESHTHLTTVVAGTYGYLDPEYNESGWLTEKSDVYSFGSVILEIITSCPAIEIRQSPLENRHISQWIMQFIETGDIESIVDQKLRGNFDTNAAWKAVELAMTCLKKTSIERPSMKEVVMELNECLALEKARKRKNANSYTGNSNAVSRNFRESEVTPHAR